MAAKAVEQINWVALTKATLEESLMMLHLTQLQMKLSKPALIWIFSLPV